MQPFSLTGSKRSDHSSFTNRLKISPMTIPQHKMAIWFIKRVVRSTFAERKHLIAGESMRYYELKLKKYANFLCVVSI